MGEFDVRELRYFVQAAVTGSMSKAAKDLFVSPQALSKGIQTLERKLEVPLLERNQGGVTLTVFGSRFLGKAQATLEDIDACDRIAEEYLSGMVGKVSACIPPGCFEPQGGTIDGRQLLRFQRDHPSVTCTFSEVSPNVGRRAVLAGDVDFTVSAGHHDTQRFDGSRLFDYPFSVVTAKSSPLARKAVVFPEDLCDGTLVLSADDGYYDDFAQGLARERDGEIDISPVRVGLRSALRMFIENSGLYMVMPLQHALRTVSSNEGAVIPFIDENGPICLPLYLLWRKDRELSGINLQFHDFIVTLYEEAHRSRTRCVPSGAAVSA